MAGPMIKRWSDSPFFKPLPAQGLYFHRRSIPMFTKVPKGCFAYGVSYYPIDPGDDKPSNPVCHLVLEVDGKRNLYLSECYQENVNIEVALDRLFMIHDGIERSAVQAVAFPVKANIYGVRTWYLTPSQFLTIDPIFADKLNEYRRMDRPIPRQVNLTPLPSPVDWAAAYRTVQSEFMSGRLQVDSNAHWTQDFLAEICQWPAVREDARVKALAIAASGLQEMIGPAPAEVMVRHAGSHWSA